MVWPKMLNALNSSATKQHKLYRYFRINKTIDLQSYRCAGSLNRQTNADNELLNVDD
jgi:hypothetical protein